MLAGFVMGRHVQREGALVCPWGPAEVNHGILQAVQAAESVLQRFGPALEAALRGLVAIRKPPGS